MTDSAQKTKKDRSLGKQIQFNLVLSGVLIVLALGATWYEYKFRPAQEKKEEASKRFLPSGVENELVKVHLVANGLDVGMECKEGCRTEPYISSIWWLTSPVSFRADEGQVKTALSSLFGASVDRWFDVQNDGDPTLADFGLDKAHRESKRLEIWLKGQAEPTVVYWGARSAVGAQVYALASVPGAKKMAVALISEEAISAFGRPLSFWRYKRLLQVEPSQVTEVEYKSGSDHWRIQKDKNDVSVWKAVESRFASGRSLDAEGVDSYLRGLLQLAAEDFVSDAEEKDRKQFDLSGSPKAVVKVIYKDPKSGGNGLLEAVFSFYQNQRKPPEEYVVVKGQTFLAKLAPGSLQRVLREDKTFWQKNLMSAAHRFAAKKVHFSSEFIPAAKSLSFTEKEGKWISGDQPALASMDSAAVERLLTRLAATKVTKFLGRSLPPGARPWLSVKVSDDHDKLLTEVTVWKRPASASPRAKESDEYIGRTPDGEFGVVEHVQDMPQKPEDFQIKATKP